MLGIIAAVAQVYYFLHESAVCRFRATVVFSVYHGEKLCFRQYEMVHYLFCFEGLHLFISVRTLIYGANHSPKHEKRLGEYCTTLFFRKIKFKNNFILDCIPCEICSDSEHVFTF